MKQHLEIVKLYPSAFSSHALFFKTQELQLQYTAPRHWGPSGRWLDVGYSGFASGADCFIGTSWLAQNPHWLRGVLNPRRPVGLPGGKPLKANIFFPQRQHYLISDFVPLSKKRGSNSSCFPRAVLVLLEARLVSYFPSMIVTTGTQLC